jgi:hypothetical protein
MQDILFGRALNAYGSVHYELLNNDLPRGTVPLTVAVGWSGERTSLTSSACWIWSEAARQDVEQEAVDELVVSGVPSRRLD